MLFRAEIHNWLTLDLAVSKIFPRPRGWLTFLAFQIFLPSDWPARKLTHPTISPKITKLFLMAEEKNDYEIDISVIIPVFNGAKWVEKCFLPILKQVISYLFLFFLFSCHYLLNLVWEFYCWLIIGLKPKDLGFFLPNYPEGIMQKSPNPRNWVFLTEI